MARFQTPKSTASTKRLPGADAQSATERDIGAFLRVAFTQDDDAPLLQAFVDLLDRLGSDELANAPPPQGLSDGEFKALLGATIAPLRIYARSISGNSDTADDLVQETLLKAWAARARFQAGTNMRAWDRRHPAQPRLQGQVRRSRFHRRLGRIFGRSSWRNPQTRRRISRCPDVQRGLLRLPAAQREALILVGAGGMAYEEVAAICDCAVGTIKSRVARGRVALSEMLTNGDLDPRRPEDRATDLLPMVDQIMSQVDVLRQG